MSLREIQIYRNRGKVKPHSPCYSSSIYIFANFSVHLKMCITYKSTYTYVYCIFETSSLLINFLLIGKLGNMLTNSYFL